MGRVDAETGEVEGTLTPLDRERARADAAEADLERAEKDLRKARRQISALETALSGRTRQHPYRKVADVIWSYYLQRLDKSPKRCTFGEKRIKAVIGRLQEERPPSYICRAIDGLAESAFVNPDTGVRYDDIELVCRDEVHIEKYHEIAQRTDAPTLLGPAWLEDLGENPENREGGFGTVSP